MNSSRSKGQVKAKGGGTIWSWLIWQGLPGETDMELGVERVEG